jgi:D-alanyl-D-alanine carboxypeptidase (penicillin-binding protein 5/6)
MLVALAAFVFAAAPGLVSDSRAGPDDGTPTSGAPLGSAAASSPAIDPHTPHDADTDTDGVPQEPVFPDVTGAAAIVVDRNSGEVLGTKNADLRWAPASTTKIMTALLAIEAINRGDINPNRFITLQDDVNIEGTDGVGLGPGDLVSLNDLLYLALVKSGGDAATAIGTAIGGSRDNFIFEMNTRARELGLTNTSYVDISGRDPEDLNEDGELPAQAGCVGSMFNVPACAHYSTVRDLATLARVALDEPLFAQIVGTTTWTPTKWIDQPSGLWIHTPMTTTNRLIRSSTTDFFPGAYGVKTGTSNQAGSNLVSAAKRYVCEGDALCGWRDVVAVVVGSAADGSSGGDRFSDSRELLEFGLSR